MGARSGGAGGRWLVLPALVALVLTAVLVLITAADLDGDPFTPNIPEAVVVERRRLPGATADTRVREPLWTAVPRRLRRRTVPFVGRVERWKALLRRSQRAVPTDVPI